MTRYFIEVSNGQGFHDCHGPAFGSATAAMLWALRVYPDHDCRAVPRLVH